MASDEELFAVIATPSPVPPIVDRARWPVHVTVAGIFGVGAPGVAAIPDLLESVLHGMASFDVELGPLDRFGAGGDVPVLLAPHPLLDEIHESLAAGLGHIPGFSPVEPDYWGDGYRPHATLGPAVSATAGDMLAIRVFSLVGLHGPDGHRRFAVNLP